MKKIINEYIVHAEELLLTYPKDELIESYLINLKSLENLPDSRLEGFDDAIPLVYEALKEMENQAQNKLIINLFCLMVENVKLAVMHDNTIVGDSDVDVSHLDIK